MTTDSYEHDDLCLADIPESERQSPTRELEAVLARDAGSVRGAAGRRFLVRTDVRSHNHGNFPGLPQRMVDPPMGMMLHHTAGRKAGDLATLVNRGTGVSANDYVTKEPVIYELCPHPRRAWHAGAPGAGVPYASDGNTNYWGIEIENLGDGADTYPAEQIDALVWRCRQLRLRWPSIDEPAQLFRHRDYAPGRKTDPSDN